MWTPTSHANNAARSHAFERQLIDSADEPGRIMVVDDNREVGSALVALLEMANHSADLIANGRAALDAVARHQPDLILLDVQLPDMDGYTVCKLLKCNPATWQIPIIIVTVEGARAARLEGIEAGADDYLEKPVDPEELEARVRSLLRASRRNNQAESAEAVIFALARAVEAKDAYTEGHLHRIAEYSAAIAERLGLCLDDRVALRYGALLHDVGKVGVDELIIRKGGPLTPGEYEAMQQHPLIGQEIVKPLRMAAAVGPIVRGHHERWDGSGYPDKLAGEDIPLGARIVAVADAFDAMTTQRPYNRVMSFAEAAALLQRGAGKNWDPTVVAAFLSYLKDKVL